MVSQTDLASFVLLLWRSFILDFCSFSLFRLQRRFLDPFESAWQRKAKICSCFKTSLTGATCLPHKDTRVTLISLNWFFVVVVAPLRAFFLLGCKNGGICQSTTSFCGPSFAGQNVALRKAVFEIIASVILYRNTDTEYYDKSVQENWFLRYFRLDGCEKKIELDDLGPIANI